MPVPFSAEVASTRGKAAGRLAMAFSVRSTTASFNLPRRVSNDALLARAMSVAATEVFKAIRRDGTQADVVGRMQSRAELYDVLDYEYYEQALDADLKAQS